MPIYHAFKESYAILHALHNIILTEYKIMLIHAFKVNPPLNFKLIAMNFCSSKLNSNGVIRMVYLKRFKENLC